MIIAFLNGNANIVTKELVNNPTTNLSSLFYSKSRADGFSAHQRF